MKFTDLKKYIEQSIVRANHTENKGRSSVML